MTRPRPRRRLPGLPGGPRRWLVGGGVLLLVAVTLLVWRWWPEREPDPRARQYGPATACLLTGADGIAGAQAGPVWGGMQDASTATRAKVQYLEIDGPQTVENGRTYLATLVGSRCDVILSAGEVPNAVVAADAAARANVRFIVVGGAKSAGNVSVVEADNPDAVRRSVRAAVTDAVADAAPR